MNTKGTVGFCTLCRKDTAYTFKKAPIQQRIRGKQYDFRITVAICNECHGRMSIPGMMDYNIEEIDRQYRTAENIVTISDIEKLMALYHIGKTPLSLALGFGEITILRYMEGQVPSKEYSQVIRRALTSSDYMKSMLEKNRAKVGKAAYKKAMEAIDELEKMYKSISPRMLSVIRCIFSELKEVTPLMLQKLLYYIQGIHLARYNRPIFEENCEAWVHGPVYRNVYVLFKDFKFNPIDDVRFSLMDHPAEILNADEKSVILGVLDAFGRYGGKALESITHEEAPWKAAREGYLENEHCREVISMGQMENYFKSVGTRYDLGNPRELNRYILDRLLI